MQRTSTFWFPAKHYGWGWGLPVCWQGWAVLFTFFALLVTGFIFLPPEKYELEFTVYATGLASLLILVCYLKGEPPTWRSGSK